MQGCVCVDSSHRARAYRKIVAVARLSAVQSRYSWIHDRQDSGEKGTLFLGSDDTLFQIFLPYTFRIFNLSTNYSTRCLTINSSNLSRFRR